MRVRNERGEPVDDQDEPTSRVRVNAQGVSASGNVGPLAVSVGKYKGMPATGDMSLPVGNGSVQIGRDGAGRFIRATQQIGGVDMDAGYDAQRGLYAEGRRTLRWGNK
jgi:hypothetical protein